jgi:hypothetical protein
VKTTRIMLDSSSNFQQIYTRTIYPNDIKMQQSKKGKKLCINTLIS